MLTRLFKIVDNLSHISDYTGSYNAYINLLLANSSLALVDSFKYSYSVSLLGVVLHQVVGNKFNGVLRSLLSNFRHGLQKKGYNSLVKVLTDGEVRGRVSFVI